MDLVTYILLGVFAIFVAIMSLRKGDADRGKSYEQKRDEMYEYYEQRMEEFKATEMRPKGLKPQEDAPEAGEPEGDPEGGPAEGE